MKIELIQALTELQMLILDWNCRYIETEKEFTGKLVVLFERIGRILNSD